MGTSNYLDRIITSKNRTASIQIVFVDVNSYSKRRSQTQVGVIDAFMKCLGTALVEVSKRCIEYAQSNAVNFQTDIIKLPSGDGAAIAFPFEGLHDIHLNFAVELLKRVAENNSGDPCPKFEEHGWCNCHDYFNLSIGVSEGKAILYKDVNDNYNIAGNTINMASRVMNLADKNQIMFTEESYRQLIDMIDNPNLDENFIQFENVKIKHDMKINVLQYINSDLSYVNSIPNEALSFVQRAASIIDNNPFGINADLFENVDENELLNTMDTISKLFNPCPTPAIEVKSKKTASTKRAE